VANDKFRDDLKGSFKISEGPLNLCLGIKLDHDRVSKTISLSQPVLIQHVITTFSQTEAHPTSNLMADSTLAILQCPDPNEVFTNGESAR
jgi:hypothetical protein